MRRDDYRATLIVMFGLATANLTGFARQAAIAHELGTGRDADVYLVAFVIPEFVFIALPIVLLPAFVPLFTECRLRAGEVSAWRFGLRVAGALLAVLLLFTVLAHLSAPLYLRWLAPGFSPYERDHTLQVVRPMLPAISLMGLAVLAGATLQVYRRFARPALATAVYNLVFIGTLLISSLGWPLDRAAWGVTLGAAATLAFQLWLLWQFRPQLRLVTSAKSAHTVDKARILGRQSHSWLGDTVEPQQRCAQVGQVARLAGPLAAGYGVHHLILFVDRAMATVLGAGSAAALNYAYHLALVVGQLSGLAVSTVLFPRLAEQIAENDVAGARASLAGALRLVWMVGLPATCGLVLLRIPLVHVLFERGAFDPMATVAVSTPLIWYGPAVLADALCQPLWRVVYARRSMWTVFAINSLQTGIRLTCNVVLSNRYGYNGLALSAAVGLSVQTLVLGLVVRRYLENRCPGVRWRHVARITLATAVAMVTMSVLAMQLSAASPSAVLLACGTVGSITYVIVLLILDMVCNHVMSNA
jgi:putative peptidoglycan lipid II flippase